MLKIPPDITFLYQIGLFLILWFVMKRLWIEPALRVIRERSARSEGAIEQARAIQQAAERLRQEHAATLERTRSEAQREMQEILRQAEAEQKRLIAEAREEAQRTLEEARSRMAEEVAVARRTLLDSAGELAHMVARKVLGRSV
jgi:F-type H+-transporting ATPase subunit b